MLHEALAVLSLIACLQRSHPLNGWEAIIPMFLPYKSWLSKFPDLQADFVCYHCNKF